MGRCRWLLVLLVAGCGRSSGFAGLGDVEETETTDAGAVPSSRCTGLPDETLGHWPMEVASPSDPVVDLGPLANDGTNEGAEGIEDGRWGRAMRFSGDDDIVINGEGLEPFGQVSMTAWVRPARLDVEWNTVVGKGGAADSLDRYWLGYYDRGLRVHLSDGVDDTRVTDPSDYGDHLGEWHHLAATYDGDSGRVVIYVDGRRTHEGIGAPAQLGYDGAPLRIGMDTNWSEPGWGFVGDIDEVKLFGCALDDGQVARDATDNWPWAR